MAVPVNTRKYRGRFAPSPTGELHFGSLVAALASYLDARANQGDWLIRIENIDQQRCKSEYAKSIIETLKVHGLLPDEPIETQSEHLPDYENALSKLEAHCYNCQCTRKTARKNASLGQLGYVYPRYCYSKKINDKGSNRRLYLPDEQIAFNDLIQGKCCYDLQSEIGDPILKRKNQEIAYALAVVVDDARQGITNIVRGADLLAATSIQIYLQKCLEYPAIQYAHIPLALNDQQQKLSKQNHATAIDNMCAAENLLQALVFLKQDISNIQKEKKPALIIKQAVKNWRIEKIK